MFVTIDDCVNCSIRCIGNGCDRYEPRQAAICDVCGEEILDEVYEYIPYGKINKNQYCKTCLLKALEGDEIIERY